MPARASLAIGGLPIGLANRVRLIRDVASGQGVTWADVAMDEDRRGVPIPPGDGGGVPLSI